MASGKYASLATLTYAVQKITSVFAKKTEIPKIDTALSATSTNAIQNKVITTKTNAIESRLTTIENKQKTGIYFK